MWQIFEKDMDGITEIERLSKLAAELTAAIKVKDQALQEAEFILRFDQRRRVHKLVYDALYLAITPKNE